jgi:hypothetical protein
MKEKLSGKPSCNRISMDSTMATTPMAIAVMPYWMAITL